MKNKLPALITVGVIAQELDTPIHRVIHVLRTRPHIRARAVAGHVRLFDDAAIGLVRAELTNIAKRRRKSGGESEGS